jgi:oligoendopeptidase F
MDTDSRIQGPAWDLTDEYASLDSPVFAADLGELTTLVATIEDYGRILAQRLPEAATLDPGADPAFLATARDCERASFRAEVLLGNLTRYISCLLSVDAADTKARELRGSLSAMTASLHAAAGAVDLIVTLCPEAWYEAFLADPDLACLRYATGLDRARAARCLSLAEERSITSLRPDGHTAWSSLYDSITGSMKVRLEAGTESRTLGLAEAAGLLRASDRSLREPAFRAINAGFALQEESCAAILNAIAGWRHTENKLRSTKEQVHYLDAALDVNHLKRRTLECMMSVVDESVEVGREALRHQARLIGVPALGPWDLIASAPSLPGIAEESDLSPKPFEESIALIAEAFGSVEPAMGDFVLEMARMRRIEGRSQPGKRPGAYCTGFPKSRKTRVYMTYQGSSSDISTLAHELGHAWHGRMVEDIPLPETRYPMCLAETASTFAEAVVGRALAEAGADDPAIMLDSGWADAQDAATFLLNIPARFAFERSFYEARAGKPLGPPALRDLMSAAWQRYYGDSLCEYDSMFWCSKLHFHMTGISFYNFPYTFGYLFSLGVLARRETLGDDFPAAYRALLRDTGRMDVEDLAHKHLGVDLAEPAFWRASVAMVRENVQRFGKLVETLGS